jgi:DNA polymerase-3 subunit delta'
MQFSRIFGQDVAKQNLIRAANANRVSHAQLFLGPEGSGKLALAIAFAQYLNCENRQETDSCGQCPSCVKAAKFIHPDIHFSFPFISKKTEKKELSTDYIEEWRKALEADPYMNLNDWYSQIDAENKQGNITVKECHDVQRKLGLKSFESRYKILILWRPEFLGNAGNVLLKMIEEPPDDTIFLLVAENMEQIITTIISRTQFTKVPRLRNQDIKQALMQEGVTDQLANYIAHLSEGNLNEARKLATHETNDNAGLFYEWMAWCVNNDFDEIVEWIERFVRLGRENQKNFLLYAMHFLREHIHLHMAGFTNARLNDQERELSDKLDTLIGFEEAEALIKLTNESYYHIERNANPRILMLDLSIRVKNQMHRTKKLVTR